MAMIQSLLDGLNHQERMRDGNQEPSMTELTVTGFHPRHNLAVIEKGVNTEEGTPGGFPAPARRLVRGQMTVRLSLILAPKSSRWARADGAGLDACGCVGMT